jgi:hypothetical protein
LYLLDDLVFSAGQTNLDTTSSISECNGIDGNNDCGAALLINLKFGYGNDISIRESTLNCITLKGKEPLIICPIDVGNLDWTSVKISLNLFPLPSVFATN